jgi:hypothetical protein
MCTLFIVIRSLCLRSFCFMIKVSLINKDCIADRPCPIVTPIIFVQPPMTNHPPLWNCTCVSKINVKNAGPIHKYRSQDRLSGRSASSGTSSMVQSLLPPFTRSNFPRPWRPILSKRPGSSRCCALPVAITIPMGLPSLRSLVPRFQLFAVAGPFRSQLRQQHNSCSRSYPTTLSLDASIHIISTELDVDPKCYKFNKL